MNDGCFIVFEGIDGAGTTTQAARFVARVRKIPRVAHLTNEPSTGPIGSMLRLAMGGRLQLGGPRQAHLMALLFAADRIDHVDQEVGPHLRDGSVVVSDRYDLSSIAYQTATARDEPEDVAAWIRALNRYAVRPAATVVLDVTPSEAERRRKLRAGAPELYEEAPLQARLAELYLRAETLLPPGDTVIHVDGNPDPDAVEAAVWQALADLVTR